jgi:hypothetical protein
MAVRSVIHRSTKFENGGVRQGKSFMRHLLEMTVAMMLGMCVLGMAFREIHVALFGTGFDNASG